MRVVHDAFLYRNTLRIGKAILEYIPKWHNDFFPAVSPVDVYRSD